MSDASKPKAAVFDIGRVIIQWDLRHLFAKLIDDSQALDHFLTHVVSEKWHHQQDEGRALSEMVAERKREFPQFADLIEAYATRFNETILGPVAGTHELIERLDAAGVPLFGLSNFGGDFWDDFRREWPVFDRFGDIVVSGHEKCAKPEARIYEIAEARFGLPPQDLLFIDDKAENIDAATARGWHGHVFTDAQALEADLVRQGLL